MAAIRAAWPIKVRRWDGKGTVNVLDEVTVLWRRRTLAERTVMTTITHVRVFGRRWNIWWRRWDSGHRSIEWNWSNRVRSNDRD